MTFPRRRTEEETFSSLLALMRCRTLLGFLLSIIMYIFYASYILMYSPQRQLGIPCETMSPRKGTSPYLENQGGLSTTQAPSAVGRVMGFQPPRQARDKRMKGCEFIATITGNSSTITSTYYGVNPGLEVTFPRLSIEARTWQFYRFHMIKFVYLGTAPSSTTGAVLLSPDYDPDNLLGDNESGLANTQDARQGNAWLPFEVVLDPAAMYATNPRKKIRRGSVPAPLSAYDSARLTVSSIANGTTNAIGKLWVVYDVEFFVPQVESPTDPRAPSIVAYNLPSDQTITTATPTVADLDETMLFSASQTVPWTNSNGTITPARGSYLVRVDLSAIDSGAEVFTLFASLFVNGAALSIPIEGEQFRSATANAAISCSFGGPVYFDGDDTCTVVVTLTGAAGTLSLRSDKSRIVFLPV